MTQNVFWVDIEHIILFTQCCNTVFGLFDYWESPMSTYIINCFSFRQRKQMFPESQTKVLSFLAIFLFSFLMIAGKKVLKVNPLSPHNTSAVLKNSSLSSFTEFTLCGRILSHQFSSGIQSILLVEHDGQVFGLGTSPGYSCDESFYQGISYFIYKKAKNFNFSRLHRLHEVRAWK